MNSKMKNILSGTAIGVGAMAAVNFLRRIKIYKVESDDLCEDIYDEEDYDEDYDKDDRHRTFTIPKENLINVPAEQLAGDEWDKFVKTFGLTDRKLGNVHIAVLAVSAEKQTPQTAQPSAPEDVQPTTPDFEEVKSRSKRGAKTSAPAKELSSDNENI